MIGNRIKIRIQKIISVVLLCVIFTNSIIGNSYASSEYTTIGIDKLLNTYSNKDTATPSEATPSEATPSNVTPIEKVKFTIEKPDNDLIPKYYSKIGIKYHFVDRNGDDRYRIYGYYEDSSDCDWYECDENGIVTTDSEFISQDWEYFNLAPYIIENEEFNEENYRPNDGTVDYTNVYSYKLGKDYLTDFMPETGVNWDKSKYSIWILYTKSNEENQAIQPNYLTYGKCINSENPDEYNWYKINKSIDDKSTSFEIGEKVEYSIFSSLRVSLLAASSTIKPNDIYKIGLTWEDARFDKTISGSGSTNTYTDKWKQQYPSNTVHYGNVNGWFSAESTVSNYYIYPKSGDILGFRLNLVLGQTSLYDYESKLFNPSGTEVGYLGEYSENVYGTLSTAQFIYLIAGDSTDGTWSVVQYYRGTEVKRVNVNLNVAQNITVTYNANGGSSTPANTSHGTTATNLAGAISKTGYTFGGWNTNSSGTGTNYSASQSLTKDQLGGNNITLYAKWVKNQYTVVYNGNGSTNGSMTNSSYTYDTDGYLKTNQFNRTGYNFIGWTTASDGTGTAYTDGQYVKNITSVNGATINLYAKWEICKYAHNFYRNYTDTDNTIISTLNISYNEALGTLPASGGRTGYTFDGWYTSATGGTKISKTTLGVLNGTNYYAHWTATNVYIKFVRNLWTNDLVLRGSKYIDYDQPIGELPTISISDTDFPSGYSNTSSAFIFDGWYTSAVGGEKIDADYLVNWEYSGTVYAHWKTKEFTVRFHDNLTDTYYYKSMPDSIVRTSSNNYGVTSNGQYISWKNTIDISPISSDGLTFKYWYTKNPSTGAQLNIIDNSTLLNAYKERYDLYAKWTINSYNINFHDQIPDSTWSKTITKEYMKKIGTLPELNRVGYEFIGWFTSPTGGTQITEETETPLNGADYYAQWKLKSYKITYYTNRYLNDSNIEKAVDLEYQSVLGELPVLTYGGFNFIGWVDSSGNEITKDTIVGANNANYYGKWSPKSIKVNYNDNLNYLYSNSGIKLGVADKIESSSIGNYKVDNDGNSLSYNNILNYTFLNSLDRDGLKFIGWTSDKENSDINSSDFINKDSILNWMDTVNGEKTLYAKYDFLYYNVRFISDSMEIENRSLRYMEKLGSLPEISKTGYTLNGWYADINDPDSKISDLTETNLNLNTLYYAKWSPNNYTVSFNVNNEDYTYGEISNKICTYDKEIGELPDVSIDGYTFLGWYTSKDGGDLVTKHTYTNPFDTTYYAHWKINTYPVVFIPNRYENENKVPLFESLPKSAIVKNIEYKSKIGELPEVSLDGYTFLGWYLSTKDSEKATVDSLTKFNGQTYYGKWKPKEFSIKFNDNLNKTYADIGKNGIPNSVKTYNNITYSINSITGDNLTYQDIFEIPSNLNRDGLIFDGWYDSLSDSRVDNSSLVEWNKCGGGVELYAHWKYLYYDIKFIRNYSDSDETISNSKSRRYMEEIGTLDSPIDREGYTFTGYYSSKTGGSKIDSKYETSLGGDTFYAHWIPNNYTITYDFNHYSYTNSGNSSISKVYVFDNKLDSIPNPSAVGYTFLGWYDSIIGGNLVDNNTDVPSHNTTYYAHWKANQYNLYFYSNHPSLSGMQLVNVEYDKKIGELPTINCDGYEFLGWYKDGSNTKLDSNDLPESHDEDYFAKWKSKQFEIEYYDNIKETFEQVKYQLHSSSNTKSYTYEVNNDGSNKNFGEVVKLENERLEYDGLEFLGWFDVNGNEITDSTNLEWKTIPNKLYAHWNFKEYKLEFNNNNPDEPYTSVYYRKYREKIGELPIISREGYKFIGWFTGIDPDSTQISNETRTQLDGYTYYAKWDNADYTMTFNPNHYKLVDEKYIQSKVVNYNGVIGELPIPEHVDGYTFNGWYTATPSEASSSRVKISPETKVPLGDTSYFADWLKNTYKLIFNTQTAKSEYSDMNVTYDNLVGTLPNTIDIEKNFKFIGWYTIPYNDKYEELLYSDSKVPEDSKKISPNTVYKNSNDTSLYGYYQLIFIPIDGKNINQRPGNDSNINTEDDEYYFWGIDQKNGTKDDRLIDKGADGVIGTIDDTYSIEAKSIDTKEYGTFSVHIGDDLIFGTEDDYIEVANNGKWYPGNDLMFETDDDYVVYPKSEGGKTEVIPTPIPTVVEPSIPNDIPKDNSDNDVEYIPSIRDNDTDDDGYTYQYSIIRTKNFGSLAIQNELNLIVNENMEVPNKNIITNQKNKDASKDSLNINVTKGGGKEFIRSIFNFIEQHKSSVLIILLIIIVLIVVMYQLSKRNKNTKESFN